MEAATVPADGTTTPAETPAANGDAAQTQGQDAKKGVEPRPYSVLVEHKLDVSSAAARKEAIEKLAELAQEGALTVFVRAGRAHAVAPRKALQALAEFKVSTGQSLSGDFTVVADNAFTEFKDIKARTKVSI